MNFDEIRADHLLVDALDELETALEKSNPSRRVHNLPSGNKLQRDLAASVRTTRDLVGHVCDCLTECSGLPFMEGTDVTALHECREKLGTAISLPLPEMQEACLRAAALLRTGIHAVESNDGTKFLTKRDLHPLSGMQRFHSNPGVHPSGRKAAPY